MGPHPLGTCSQKRSERLQVHYLSPDSQNECITECSNLVKQHILLERQSAKYFAIIVDATPDSSHIEQTTFLLRYILLKETQYEFQERFLKFADCSNKRGEKIVQLITDTLKEHAIPLSDCRAQAYDNGANMAGKYNGTQSKIQEKCSIAIFSPCGFHTLNLCGNDDAECIPEAITFFGTIQTVYHCSVPVLSAGNYYKTVLVVLFMVCLKQDGQIVLNV